MNELATDKNVISAGAWLIGSLVSLLITLFGVVASMHFRAEKAKLSALKIQDNLKQKALEEQREQDITYRNEQHKNIYLALDKIAQEIIGIRGDMKDEAREIRSMLKEHSAKLNEHGIILARHEEKLNS